MPPSTRLRLHPLLALSIAAILSMPASATITMEPGWPQTTGFSVSQSAAAGQFDADPELEIAIASQDGCAYLYNHDGTLLPGWPRTMGSALGPDQWVNQCSSPAIYDLDGDGRNEMIVGCFNGRMYAFRADGTQLPGWPFAAAYMIFSTPAIGDIDGDGAPEVVFGANDGNIYAVNADGTICAGFPVATPYVVRSSPALGDLDGDGHDEIVITADNSNYQLYALDGDGTNLPGFPKYLWSSGSNSSPSLADIDGDGSLEIVVGARDGSLHVMHRDGTYLPGWPLNAGYSLQSSPTLVNLDADPQLEIVVGLNDSKVSVYKLDGTLLPGWPKATAFSVISSASVGDIDGDGAPEIVIGDNTGVVYGWNPDGTVVPGFPLTDATYTIYSSPLLEDLDRDGSCELLIGCNDTRIYCWDLGAGTYNPASLAWPKWRLDNSNDATIPAVNPASISEGPLDPGGTPGSGASELVAIRPNPVRGEGASIEYRLEGPASASLHILDVCGREVRHLLCAGARSVHWDGCDESGRPVAAGVYLYRLDGSSKIGRAVVVR